MSFFLLVLAACDKPSKSPLEPIETFRPYPTAWFVCGDLGEACCHAPGGPVIPSLGHLVACSEGLGCDVRTDTCVNPCGGTGQVCCDGPETRAPKWTADGRVFSLNYINMREPGHFSHHVVVPLFHRSQLCVYRRAPFGVSFDPLVGRHLNAFLRQTSPYAAQPVLAEMAAFEWPQGEVFDAEDSAAVTVEEMACFPRLLGRPCA